MKRILELVKGGHYVRVPARSLAERPHAEWLIRQGPWNDNKKMSCTGMGIGVSPRLTPIYFLFVMSFPRERKCSLPPTPSTVAPPAAHRVGGA